jgi:hypothetical protein
MNFYLWAMRSASVLLFVYALVALVSALVIQLESLGAMGSSYGPGLGGSGIARLMSMIVGSLGAAAWPLFGAALLWRVDRWLGTPAGPAAKAE